MHHTNDDGNNQWKWTRDAFVFVLALAVVPVPISRGLPTPSLAGYYNYSGYRSAAKWQFIQRNLQHRPIFLNSLSRHHLIKPRVSFNICPFVLSTSGHFIMPWVQLPFKGPEKSIIFCSRLGIIQCTDEDKLQEFQKPEIKVFIFVKSRSGALTESSAITSKVIFQKWEWYPYILVWNIVSFENGGKGANISNAVFKRR